MEPHGTSTHKDGKGEESMSEGQQEWDPKQQYTHESSAETLQELSEFSGIGKPNCQLLIGKLTIRFGFFRLEESVEHPMSLEESL